MKPRKGDLVACYLTNSEVHEELLEWGLVLDTNPSIEDIYVLDSKGVARWWPAKRWRILKSKKDNNFLDLPVKTV